MPFQTPFNPGNPFFDGQISAEVHEHDAPPGSPPTAVIRTDQDWSVHVDWETSGWIEGMISGQWHLHCMLESIGPGDDYDLVDPADHLIPLTPWLAPNAHYSAHFDVNAGVVDAPAAGSLYKLVVSLTYREPGAGGAIGSAGPVAAYVDGPILQFYQP